MTDEIIAAEKKDVNKDSKLTEIRKKILGKNNKRIYEKIIQEINIDIYDGNTIADIGAGNGKISLNLAKRASVVKACDISGKCLREAKKKAEKEELHNIGFSIQDVYKLRFKKGVFDVAIMCNVLHLLERPEDAIEQVKKIVKKGGIIILPQRLYDFKTRTKVFFRMSKDNPEDVLNAWNEEEYIDFIIGCGLKVEKAVIMDGIPRVCYLVAKKY